MPPTYFPTDADAAAAGPCRTGRVHPPCDLSEVRPAEGPGSERGNLDLVGRFIGAALAPPAGCVACQHAALGDVVTDPDTVGFLVDFTAVMLGQAAAALGLPPGQMTSAATLPDDLRALWRLGTTEDTRHAMYDQCAKLTIAERRAAASGALDLIVGQAEIIAAFGDGR